MQIFFLGIMCRIFTILSLKYMPTSLLSILTLEKIKK